MDWSEAPRHAACRLCLLALRCLLGAAQSDAWKALVNESARASKRYLKQVLSQRQSRDRADGARMTEVSTLDTNLVMIRAIEADICAGKLREAADALNALVAATPA